MKEHYTIAENEDLIKKFKYVMDMPGYFCIFEPPLIYKSISPDLAILLGWNKPENAINQPAEKIPSHAVEGINLYHKYSNITIKLQNPVIAIQIVRCKRRLAIFFYFFSP